MLGGDSSQIVREFDAILNSLSSSFSSTNSILAQAIPGRRLEPSSIYLKIFVTQGCLRFFSISNQSISNHVMDSTVMKLQ